MKTSHFKHKGRLCEAHKVEIQWREGEEICLRVRNTASCKGFRLSRAQADSDDDRITVVFTEGSLNRVIQHAMRKDYIC